MTTSIPYASAPPPPPEPTNVTQSDLDIRMVQLQTLEQSSGEIDAMLAALVKEQVQLASTGSTSDSANTLLNKVDAYLAKWASSS